MWYGSTQGGVSGTVRGYMRLPGRQRNLRVKDMPYKSSPLRKTRCIPTRRLHPLTGPYYPALTAYLTVTISLLAILLVETSGCSGLRENDGIKSLVESVRTWLLKR